MSKNVLIAALCAIVAGLAVTTYFLYEKLQARLAAEAAVVPAPVSDVLHVASILEPEIEAAAPAHRVAAPASAPVPAAARPAPASKLLSGIADMLKDPAMKSMLREQQKVAVEMQFAALLKCLNLPPEKLDALKELLLDRQMAMMDSGMGMMSGQLSEDDRRAMTQKLKDDKASFDARIADLVGAENADMVQQYDETQAERMQVQMLKQSMSAGEPLSEQQEHDLIRAMYEERTTFVKSGALPSSDTPDPAMFNPDNLNKMMEQTAKLRERYAARATAILSPDQLKQFKKSQDQQAAMEKMGMKMAAQMFGGKTEEKASGK